MLLLLTFPLEFIQSMCMVIKYHNGVSAFCPRSLCFASAHRVPDEPNFSTYGSESSYTRGLCGCRDHISSNVTNKFNKFNTCFS